ncbi:MAG: hypothetical protein KDD58_10640, partial [Bdellovibrionales bacterium]|nr:hypothetical protein [Bdellovibrionales bacterium]
KVQITYKGEKRPGFVFIEDIKFSYMRSKASRIEFSNHQIYRQNKTMSLGVSFNYLLQDGYRIESSGYSLETTEFTSISAAFNFSHEWPWKDHFNLRASVAFKNANWSSEIKQTGATLPANFINEVEDNIGYLAIGGLLKWYPTSSQTFWLGPGLEYMWDRGGRERKISGNLDTDKGLDDASYINFSISTGIDVHLTDNFFLLPEFKASTSLDQTPSIYGLEAGLAIGYVY